MAGSTDVSSGRKRAPVVGKVGKGRVSVGDTVEQPSEEMVAAERSAMIAQRQAELETLNDRHDSMVRELFHMDRFRIMTAYDPVQAKQDESPVFHEFKAKFDLMDKSDTVGPSRSTRRAQTARRQTIQGQTHSVSAPLITPKGKNKLKDNNALWEILSSARKGKGKEKAILEKAPPSTASSVTSPVKPCPPEVANGDSPQAERLPSLSIHIKRKPSRRRLSITDGPDPPDPPNDSIINSTPKSTPAKPTDIECTRSEGQPPARKRRKTELLPVTNGLNGIQANGGADTPRRSTRHSLSSFAVPALPTPQRPTHGDKHPPNSMSSAQFEPVTPKIAIKRIKLVVRRPPPLISNPKQKPLPPRHNCSLQAQLNSYTILHDQDVTSAALDEAARTDAAVLERAESFKRQGRFVPGAEFLLGDPPDLTTNNTPKRTTTDIWDDIIAAAAAASKARPKKPLGVQIAGQIATKIQAYWDGHAARQDKARALEEKKLRALAKTTIRAVVNEWKKAVFHIREQERLRVEAEERKRGHEHLDAILNQSGQILEAQHGDLARGDVSRSRSRSGSLPVSHGDWSSDEEEEDEDAEEEMEEERHSVADGDSGEEGDLVEGDEGVFEALLDDAEEKVLEGSGAEEEVSRPASEAGDIQTPGAASDEESDEEDGLGARALLGDEGDDRRQPSVEVATPLDELHDPSEAPEPAIPDVDDEVSDMQISTPFDSSRDPSMPPAEMKAPSIVSKDISTKRELTQTPCAEGTAVQASAVVSSDTQGNAFDAPDRDVSSPQVVIGQPEAPDQADAALIPDVDTPAEVILESLKSPSISEAPVVVDAPSKSIERASTEQTVDPDHVEEEQQGMEVIEEEAEEEPEIPEYLRPYAVAPVKWDPQEKIKPPILLRGILRPYQQAGLEWLASLHANNLNGILADEMGLGKTIQTISLLAHLACDRGIWGPHLIVVPTSVLLNWEMELKKFLPGFQVLSYHGNMKRRKELRQGWNDKSHFNVCITSYTLASRDAHIFKRKAWYYMILDEAHMIKNFKSQRWNILLMFRSFRRLLLTGTPLQNNLTELWALLQFLMSGANFANLKEFGEWFSNPLEKAIEMGHALDDETMQRVSKLHTVLRPYLLRRLKRDVEKELPSKYEHLVLCPLSKRQRFLYDEFMSRAHTRDALESGVYQKIANILMQLRKVCNHPDLFEVRPIVTSFAMDRAAVADFEIKELLVRRRFLQDDEEQVNLGVLGLRFVERQNTSLFAASETKRLDATSRLPFISELPGEPPPKDTRTAAGFRAYSAYQRRVGTIARWAQIGYLNRLRCQALPVYSEELLKTVSGFSDPLVPLAHVDTRLRYLDTGRVANSAVKTYAARADEMSDVISKFAFATPAVVARDMPRFALPGLDTHFLNLPPQSDDVLHQASVKLQIAFPDPSLLQYDCGKLQELTRLLREKKAGGHRVLIFTQMTRVLDILEIFLNLHGYLYLRLDGATKIEDRQYITERFNVDARIFCFIASSRSGGVGINLTGADTVVFYDSDFNPQMDRQCEDRAHRIGQIRDVHIYRFVSQHTVEEALLRKANQKRSLDDLVIQKGEFDWRSLFTDEGALTQALGEFEDTEDAHAAAVAAREEVVMEGADEADFGGDAEGESAPDPKRSLEPEEKGGMQQVPVHLDEQEDEPEEEGGTVVDYMLLFVKSDYDFFRDWRL
ncbi:hypothetical protein HGRIS_001875 [Hohenbuehelia grisea]|uniref:Helicase SWR1 n=1 Tax=Hohenbuehelia grisea TaxID=104357 RepID=A0ABR3JKH8_9AGAR